MKVLARRIASYDFFRGILLVGMITAHVFYNFFEITPSLWAFFQWIPAGFLFFTGIVAGEILLTKKDNLYFIRRAIQLLGIFLFFNAIKLFLEKISYSVFFWGILVGDQANLSFEILLPIAILFLLIPFLRTLSLPGIGLFLFGVLLFILDLLAKSDIFYSYNLHFAVLGIFGFFLGRTISLDEIRERFSNAFHIFPLVNMVFVVGFFLLFFTAGEVFLWQASFWSFQTLIVLLLYFSLPNIFHEVKSLKSSERSHLRKFFEILGVNSLFLYVFHIAFLGAVVAIFPNLIFVEWWQAVLFTLNVLIFSFAVVKFLEQIFRYSPKSQNLFRFLF